MKISHHVSCLCLPIGPVQSFIEAARKTEDLWMGSYILSYLVATAMEKVQGDGVEIIYPDYWKLTRRLIFGENKTLQPHPFRTFSWQLAMGLSGFSG